MRVFIFKYLIYFITIIFNALFRKKYIFLGESEKFFRNGGCIAPTWHQNIMLYCGINFHKAGGLASKSRDGDYMTKLAEKKGWRPFRGSSSRGGKEVLDKIIHHFKNIESDMTLMITPDGPRGPGMKSKRGIFEIAKETGVPIIPVVPVIQKYKTVDSWDFHKLPRPFQTCYYVFGEPMFVDPKESDDSFKQYRDSFDKKMAELSALTPEQIKISFLKDSQR